MNTTLSERRISLLSVLSAHLKIENRRAAGRAYWYKNHAARLSSGRASNSRHREKRRQWQRDHYEERRNRLGIRPREVYLAAVTKTPEEHAKIRTASARRHFLKYKEKYQRLAREKYMQKRMTTVRQRMEQERQRELKPKPQKTPKSVIVELARRRRKYVSWWKKALHEKYPKQRKEIPITKRLRLRLQKRLQRMMAGRATAHTESLLGCNLEHLKVHLERQFKPMMSWENYGTFWSIDHITPYSLFDLTNEVHLRMLCHYTNLQPLGCLENSIKGSSTPNGHQPQLPIPALLIHPPLPH